MGGRNANLCTLPAGLRRSSELLLGGQLQPQEDIPRQVPVDSGQLGFDCEGVESYYDMTVAILYRGSFAHPWELERHRQEKFEQQIECGRCEPVKN